MSISTRVIATTLPKRIQADAMRLHLPATVPALAALAPLVEGGFGFGRSLFTRPMVVHTPGSLLREHESLSSKVFSLSSPKYEITDTDDKFQLSVDVPGMKASDINVSIENDVLSLRGEHTEEKENYSFASKFYQSFSLDPAIETDKFEAELKDGVLSLSAPKDLKKVEENIKRIPITEFSEAEKSADAGETEAAASAEETEETLKASDEKEIEASEEKIELNDEKAA